MSDSNDFTRPEESCPPDNAQHSLSAEEFAKLHEKWWYQGMKICVFQGVDPDDAEDIVSIVLEDFRQSIEKKEFIFKSERSTMNYLSQKTKWRIKDYHREEKRKKNKLIPWQRERIDGQIHDVEDYVSDENVRDSMDSEQRAYVVEIAELCHKDRQINEQQLELVRWRMLGEPLAEEWSQSKRDTNWNRIKTIIRLRALKELDD